MRRPLRALLGLPERGMPGFADALEADEIRRIQAYLQARAAEN